MSFQSDKVFFKAMQAINEKRMDEAYVLLEQDADSARSLAWRGYITAEFFKDDPHAESFFKSAVDKDPAYADTYLFYASLLLRHERFAEMNANINKAAAISGTAKDKIHHLTGLLNEAQGNLDAAEECYRKAILASFDNNLIDLYTGAIERCERKKRYR